MKENTKFVNIEKVQSLEQYLWHVGIFCISLQSLIELHKLSISRGIFDDDEIENSETIVYEIGRLLTAINDQIRMTSRRSGQPWSEILKKVIDEMTPDKQIIPDKKITTIKRTSKRKKS